RTEGSDGRTAPYVRGRTGQEGQRPQGGQPGGHVGGRSRWTWTECLAGTIAGHGIAAQNGEAHGPRAPPDRRQKNPGGLAPPGGISDSFLVLRTDSLHRPGSSRTGSRL